MQSRVISEGLSLVGIAGSGVLQGNRVKYANIHETGGVIRPVHGKYLTIPIRSGGASHSSKIEGFRRVKQVTIPARKYMSRSLQEVSGRLLGVLRDGINKGLAG
jgi:phage gpG-like protein